MLKTFLLVIGIVFVGASPPARARAGRLLVDLDVDQDAEEVLSVEARGLLSHALKKQIDDCLGNVRNIWLTNIDSPQGFVNCIKHICTEGFTSDKGGMDDDIIYKAMDCVGLAEGMGPGPGNNWHDYRNKRKMMKMTNRGKLGFCLRYDRRKC